MSLDAIWLSIFLVIVLLGIDVWIINKHIDDVEDRIAELMNEIKRLRRGQK